MRRRTFLLTAGATAGIATSAGCSEDGGGDGSPGGTGTGDGNDGRGSGETRTTGDDADEGTPTPGATDTATSTGSGRADVLMVTDGSEYYFDPAEVRVEPGRTVVWINETGAHSTTAYHEDLDAAETTRIPAEAEPWDSGVLSEPGATFEHAFETPGTYEYFCLPHEDDGMTGRIVVGEPGTPSGDDDSTDS